MSIQPLDQAFSLLGAFLVGLALGLLYDLIRPFRRRAAFWLEFMLDLLYWLLVTLVIFLCAPLLSRGYVSLFMIAVHGLGAFCYFKLLSRPIRWLSVLLDRIISRLLSLLLWPYRRIESILTAALSQFFMQIKKTAKKLFSFPIEWVKMRHTLKKSKAAAKEAAKHKEEVQHDQNKKGWSCD